MGSEISEAKVPTSVEPKTAITPRIPQDITDEILDHLAADSDLGSLRACALVSKSWIPSCQQHIFHTVDFTWPKNMDRWFNTFPVPEESPAHHVRVLYILIEGVSWLPEEFLEHSPQFTGLRRLFLLGDSMGFRLPSHRRLPESVTSLTIGT